MSTTEKKPAAPIELGHLGCGEWEQRLDQLARDAVAAGPDAPLQARLDLAMAAFSMLWLGWSPPLIARSARASIALREPVLVADPGQLDVALLSSRAARREGLKHLEQLPQPGTDLAPVMIDDDDHAQAAGRAPAQGRRSSVPPLPRDPNLLTVAEVAGAVGMSASWVHKQLRLKQLLEGVHYRRRQPGEPRGFMFHREATMATLQELLPAKRQLAEQVLAELQGAGDGWAE
jgi:hypothetical protein